MIPLLSQQMRVAEFVAKLTPGIQTVTKFDKFSAIGFEEDDKLVAGVVFHNFTGFSVDVAFADTNPNWATPEDLKIVFQLPFEELQVARITAPIGRKNMRARRFVEGIGFKYEGMLRRGFDGRQDLILYGCLKENCRWLSLEAAAA